MAMFLQGNGQDGGEVGELLCVCFNQDYGILSPQPSIAALAVPSSARDVRSPSLGRRPQTAIDDDFGP